MREWIEEQERKRAIEIMSLEFDIGDLVQGMGNFSDVWFEILSISRYRDDQMSVRFNSVTFVTYSKYGDTRHTDNLYFGDIRKVAKQTDVNPRQNRIALRDRLICWGQVIEWPDKEPKGYSNYPQRHPNSDTLLAAGRRMTSL